MSAKKQPKPKKPPKGWVPNDKNDPRYWEFWRKVTDMYPEG